MAYATNALPKSITCILLGLSVVSLTVVGCGSKEEAPPSNTVKTVKIMTVASNSGLASREFPGQVQASESAEMSFRVSGRLIELPVSAGQKVEAGAVLAKIDPRDFQSHVDSTTSALGEAEAQVTAMKARVIDAQLRHERTKESVESGIAAVAELDRQRKTLDVAIADAAAAEQGVNGLRAQLREAQGSLDDTVLLAPFEGAVARTFVENFQDVQLKQPIVLLQNDAIVDITISISESDMIRANREADIGEIARDLDGRANVEFAALAGQSFPVMLKDYETEADPTTQTFAVTLTMAPPSGVSIRSGMNATVIIIAREEEDTSQVFQVPVGAVIAGPSGESLVWRVDESGRVAPATVEIGTLVGNNIEITAGLNRGDRIATSAANSLREGMTVRALTTDVED